jgi:indolepyruvate ferredoxin oxidoreductase alpha subunit
MHQEYLMGNEAIGLGALAAGIRFAGGYPGTPSTEVLETVARHNADHRVFVEWSTNEKAGLETAFGAAMSGARALVTMKQVGLNVAVDPLMSLEYLGVEGGLVLVVADDPGPISSQTEQDTRHFASFAKVPCFDPSTVQEAYEMIQEAFDFSEKYHTPVLFRPTTRVDHGYASVTVKDESEYAGREVPGFVRDTRRWVIFPRLSFAAHQKIEARDAELSKVLSDYPRNQILPGSRDVRRGIATHGVSFPYVQEALDELGAGRDAERPRVLRVATPFPFPETLAVEFLRGLDEVICLEELDPVIERELTYLCGKYQLPVKIRGKLTGDNRTAGENTRDSVYEVLQCFLGLPAPGKKELPPLPVPVVRPPVLCAGCPHRASFYAVKQAMKGQKAVFCGDIGCYTLGNAMPLDMVDTCLCMGAGVNIAQGIASFTPGVKAFAFVGDSTYFASALTGVTNGVYNQADFTLVVLDNSTTAMTGHQPHPGTGFTMMGQFVDRVSIEDTLRGIGVKDVRVVDPLDQEAAVAAVRETAAEKGVKAIIFRSPCIALVKPLGRAEISQAACRKCRKCIREIGCPALVVQEGNVVIDTAQCTGCGLCAQVCPFGAIEVSRRPDGGESKCPWLSQPSAEGGKA